MCEAVTSPSPRPPPLPPFRSLREANSLLVGAGPYLGRCAFLEGTWEVLRDFRTPLLCFSQSPNQKNLLAAGVLEAVHVLDLAARRLLCSIKLEEGQLPTDVQFDPLSTLYLLVGGWGLKSTWVPLAYQGKGPLPHYSL